MDDLAVELRQDVGRESYDTSKNDGDDPSDPS